MSDLSKLKRLRAGNQAVCTKLVNRIDAVISGGDEVQITSLHKQLIGSLSKVKDYDQQILDVLPEEGVTDEIIKQSDYESKVEDKVVELELAVKGFKTAGDKTMRRKEVKLPTLSLTTFDGDPKTWKGFWELFKCAVDDREDLTNIQKFTYLKGQMQEEALTLISGFSMEGASYEPAKNLLTTTYRQEEQIKAAYISAFYNLTAPAYSVRELKGFHAAAECSLRAITTAGITLQEFCTVLLAQKLPAPLKENIRRELRDQWLDIEQFTAALLREIQTLEANDNDNSHKVFPASTAAFAVPPAYCENNERASQAGARCKTCLLCNKPGHYWVKCRTYKTGCERVARARVLQLCTSCLSRDHGNQGCSNTKIGPCKFCQKKHFFGLCPRHGKQTQAAENKGPRETSTTLTSVTSKSTTILPTIQIPLYTVENKVKATRALLDQCSQRSFVLRSRLEGLRHKAVGQVQLQLQGFTGAIEMKDYEVVALSFRHKARVRSLCAVVVDQLPIYKSPVGLKGVHKRLEKKGYGLADPKIALQGEIDLLIGADHYYDIVHAGYVRDEGVVLIPTIYGYALSGQFRAPDDGTNVEVVTILKVATHPVEAHINSEVEMRQSPPEIKDLNALWELDHVGIVPEEISNKSKRVLYQLKN